MKARAGVRITVLVGLLIAVAVLAADLVIVEDWAALPVGTKGIPAGWSKQDWGSPKYDFTVIEQDGQRVLHLKSAGDSSNINKDIRGKVRLAETPILEWTWKVTKLPAGADLRRKETSDTTGHIFLVWPRFPAMVRSRVIGYVWDEHLAPGTVETSRKTGLVTFIVVRSGTAELGRWFTDRRNVAEDYRRVFRESPVDPQAIALSIDTNDTRAPAETTFGAIRLLSSA